MGVNSLPKTVTRQRHGCDLNPGPSAPESSTLTTRLPSQPDGSPATSQSINQFIVIWQLEAGLHSQTQTSNKKYRSRCKLFKEQLLSTTIIIMLYSHQEMHIKSGSMLCGDM